MPSRVGRELGTYELAVAHRGGEHWGAKVIAALARYTCDARFGAG